MHGRREGEEQSKRLPRQHMWPPVGIDKDKSTTEKDLPFPAGSSPPSGSPSSHFFFKDGRKIGVGDCALFQAGDAPPFIGLIRWIRTQEQDAFAKLCVSWLYRPADVKLPKGVQLNSAPNEVFYSFHKDVISSASILHPCRVAFLKKGVEPPSGTPSFVCRRVYDIEHKCLWWLTDKDYINERQEEVDALLDRTRQEMHAAVQSGGRSPKPLNGPSSSQQQQQLKSGGSDSSQNLGTGNPSFASSQPKGKKRERSDQTAEPANKRELRDRSNPKLEDADPAGFKFDNLKAEVAKMTDKGGLSDTEAVDKLVSMIQLDRTERKLDFPARVMLADVIANTNRDDCLDRFVQLRGVPVLDEWLQEAHKQGKNMGDSGSSPSPKEGDASNNSINKPVEDLLLALLRALDKLPVNLNALRNCNIGKSVNHLKNHKNLEIQKKARFLVDTWKKRVDAEMKINDGKLAGSGQAVAWQGKPSFLEVNRRTGSSEPVIRGPAAHLASSKSLPAKTMLNNPVTSSGQLKPQSPLSGAGAYKGAATGAGNSSSEPPAGAGEEKSTSSSQSQNNSQSCSSDHAKTLGGGSPWKEDARSSTAGSMYKNRQRRLVNGPPGAGPQKETINNAGAVKSGPPDRTSTVEKTSQSGVASEKHGDTTPVSAPEHGNNTRLIVRLPNLGRSPGRSPARGTSAGAVSSEEPSPAVTDKHETNVTNNNDRKGNEVKEASVAAPDEGDRASAVIEDTDTGKGGLRNSCSSSGNEKGPAVVVKNSFSSMNALIESCVKYSEVSTPPQAGDDIGMNLLASVAAGEISKSEHGSPDILPEEHCEADNNKGKVLEKGNAAPKTETSDGENNKMDSVSLNENKVKMETNEMTPKSETNKDSDSVRKPDGPVKQDCDNKRDNASVETNKDNRGDCKPTVRGRQGNDDDKSNSSCAASEKTGEGNIATCGRSGQDRKESEKGPPCEEAYNNNPVMKSDKAPETTKMEFPKDNNEVKDPSCITPRVELETKSRASELANHVSKSVKPDSDVTGGREEPGSAKPCSDTPTKLDFDLNEGIGLDDTSQCEPTTSAPAGPSIVHNIPSLSPFLPSSSGRPINSPITVVAAPAKLPFEPPETLLQRPNKGETGWKGSAATSAFRPAEPRKVLEMQLGCASDTVRASSDKSSKQSRPLLEFDLNVADDRAIEEEVSQSSAQTTGSSARGFDLDLNRVDTDAVENNNSSLFLSNNYLSGSGQSRVEVPLMPLRPPSYNNRHNNNNATEVANGLRDFDLNNGPALDEAGSELIARGQIVRNASTNANMPFLHPVAGLRMNSAEVGSNNMASWIPPGNSYPAVAIPSFIPERSGEPPQPYSLIAAPAGAAQRIPLGGPHPFGGGQNVLSSSPAAMAFSPAAFPYAGFHFSPTFPLGSAANYAEPSSGMPSVFPTMPSQIVGPGGQAAVSSSHYLPPRPYLMNLTESSNTSGGSTGGSHDSRRWARQAAGAGLDLNSGPGGADVDSKDEKGGPVIMRQILGGVGGMAPQAFADEQPRMFQMGGGKRKEPDGGWDSDASRSVHKQLSWH
ncbi:hypothetical protein LUZ60_000310 [Juncus effusus]|nr:hypothetical protein LUZ60_000310 [Juncus effusus]